MKRLLFITLLLPSLCHAQLPNVIADLQILAGGLPVSTGKGHISAMWMLGMKPPHVHGILSEF